MSEQTSKDVNTGIGMGEWPHERAIGLAKIRKPEFGVFILGTNPSQVQS